MLDICESNVYVVFWVCLYCVCCVFVGYVRFWYFGRWLVNLVVLVLIVFELCIFKLKIGWVLEEFENYIMWLLVKCKNKI